MERRLKVPFYYWFCHSWYKKKIDFWYKKNQSNFLISKIHIFDKKKSTPFLDIQKWIFWYHEIDFWYKKMNYNIKKYDWILYIKNRIISQELRTKYKKHKEKIPQ